jgi:pyruvate/2-oxoglutarate dehydrogenase complex dihydrolipoamide acyltransferase (E2) component
MESLYQKIPQLSLGGPECTVVQWLKQPQETVCKGEPLLILRNDRAEYLIPAEQSAVLEQQVLAVGDTAVVGAVLAAWQAPEPLPRYTPVARNIIEAHQADADSLAITGSGYAGRITKADVFAALDLIHPQPPCVVSPNDADLQNTVPAAVYAYEQAELVSSPAYQAYFADDQPFALTAMQVSCDSLMQFCCNYNAQTTLRYPISPQLAIAWSALQSLRSYPLVYAYWHDQAIIRRKNIHLQIHDIDNGFIIERNIPTAQDYNIRGLARSWQHPNKPEPFSFHIHISEAKHFQTHLPGLGISGITQCAMPSDTAAMHMQNMVFLTLSYDTRIYDQPYADAFLQHLAQTMSCINDIF